MELTELTREETMRRIPIGETAMVIVSIEDIQGHSDYSERVRAMVNAQAPDNARAYRVERSEGLPTPVEVKVWGSIIGGERKSPLRTETQPWYAHPVTYYN